MAIFHLNTRKYLAKDILSNTGTAIHINLQWEIAFLLQISSLGAFMHAILSRALAFALARLSC